MALPRITSPHATGNQRTQRVMLQVLLATVPLRCFAPTHWTMRLMALLVLCGVYFLVTDELDFAENQPIQFLLAGVGLVSVLAFASRSASALKAS